jgi:hypothetical protein
MAAVTTLGTVTFNTTAGNKTVTATPAVGDLLVVIAGASGTSEANAATTAVTDNNSSGTYYKIADSLGAGASPRISLWIRETLVASAVSTIITAAQANSSGGGLHVFKVTGMSRAGLRAARRAGANFSATGTPSVALITPIDTNNAVIGGVINGSTAPILTEPTGWTERNDTNYSTPTTALETATRDSGETTATPTWGSASGTAWRAVVVELDTRADAAKALLTLGVGE